MSCPICGEELDGEEFCKRHKKAYLNIKQAFNDWKKALDISWDEYLNKLIENKNSGKWVKEVAEYLLSQKIQ